MFPKIGWLQTGFHIRFKTGMKVVKLEKNTDETGNQPGQDNRWTGQAKQVEKAARDKLNWNWHLTSTK